MEVRVDEKAKYYVINAQGLEGKRVDVYVGDKYLLTAEVGRKGLIRIRKDRDAGKALKLALAKGEKVKVRF